MVRIREARFGGDRDLELRRNTFFKELDKYSSSKERSRIINLLIAR
jgi:hypothetical protein